MPVTIDTMTRSGFLWVKTDSIFNPTTAVQKKLQSLLADKEVRRQIHQAYANRTEKYVPLDTGALRESVQVKPGSVSWRIPYAHYMHEGQVYGPNIPILMKYDSADNQAYAVGFWSPPGKRKHPTGRPLKYYTPGTGSHWSTKVMENYVDKMGFQREATQILKRNSKKR